MKKLITTLLALCLTTTASFSDVKLGIIIGPNLQLVNNLGNVSTYNISGDRVNISSELYHLVTDTKTLSVGKNKFLDFNGSLEVFDDI